jgi:hypothetical protein
MDALLFISAVLASRIVAGTDGALVESAKRRPVVREG